jgi:hypothetical protein
VRRGFLDLDADELPELGGGVVDGDFLLVEGALFLVLSGEGEERKRKRRERE